MKTAIASLLIISLLSSSYGCSCSGGHPQMQLCAGNTFVALLNAYKMDVIRQGSAGNSDLDEIIPPNSDFRFLIDGDRRYKIEIVQSFKGLENVTEEMKNFLYTPYFSSLCGDDLRLNTTYLVAGNVYNGRLKFSLCSYNVEWQPLPELEKANILANIEMLDSVCESGCEVRWCFWRGCQLKNSPNRCVSVRETLNVLCRRDENGDCGWKTPQQ